MYSTTGADVVINQQRIDMLNLSLIDMYYPAVVEVTDKI